MLDPVQIVPKNEPAASAFFLSSSLSLMHFVIFCRRSGSGWSSYCLLKGASSCLGATILSASSFTTAWKNSEAAFGSFCRASKMAGTVMSWRAAGLAGLGLPNTPQFRARQLALPLAVARPPAMEAIVLATVDQIIPDAIPLRDALCDSLPLLVRPSNQYALRACFLIGKNFWLLRGETRGGLFRCNEASHASLPKKMVFERLPIYYFSRRGRLPLSVLMAMNGAVRSHS